MQNVIKWVKEIQFFDIWIYLGAHTILEKWGKVGNRHLYFKKHKQKYSYPLNLCAKTFVQWAIQSAPWLISSMAGTCASKHRSIPFAIEPIKIGEF